MAGQRDVSFSNIMSSAIFNTRHASLRPVAVEIGAPKGCRIQSETTRWVRKQRAECLDSGSGDSG